MKTLYRICIISIIILSSVLCSYANDPIRITKGHIDPINIAIADFSNSEESIIIEKNNIINVINNDLSNCGIFKVISTHSFIETKIGVMHQPLFAAWRQINVNLLLNGTIKKISNNRIQIKIILWDPILEKELINESFEFKIMSWRRVAHKIADKIYYQATGNQGYFDTKIVYVSEQGPYLKRKKRIAIMDQDGANHRYLTNGDDLVLTPKFSPDNKEIVYLSYKKLIPKLYIVNLKTGVNKILIDLPGMFFSPRFSPDGEHLLLSIAKNSSTHIYEINLSTKKISQLTTGNSINTSANYSPDGQQIVFNSDRNGTRQLYIMNRNGSNISRITYDYGIYAEPTWSCENLIAFTKISKAYGFAIGIMNAESNNPYVIEKLIAKGYLVENPCWAKNGKVLVFTKGKKPNNYNDSNINKIYRIDFTGANEHMIPTPYDASDPDWSK